MTAYHDWTTELSTCCDPLDTKTLAGMFHVLVRQWFDEMPGHEDLAEWLRIKVVPAEQDPCDGVTYIFDGAVGKGLWSGLKFIFRKVAARLKVMA